MFRIVPDQLRISEGWVRCGQCDEVFDANVQMRSLDETLSPPLASPQAPQQPAPPVREEPQPAPYVPAQIQPLPEPAEPAYDWGLVLSEPPPAPTPEPQPESAIAESVALGVPSDAPQAPDPQDLGLAEAAQDLPVPLTASDDWTTTRYSSVSPFDNDAELLGNTPMEALADDPPPSFMVGRAGARTSSSWLGKKVLLGASTLLVLLLLGQVLLQERDRLAAASPALQPWLEAGCEALACRLAPLREIESIAIDSSAFTSVRPGVYFLHVSLKNTAAMALATPALELTLTDAQDRPLLRRVVRAAELSDKASLAGGSELAASLPISVKAGATPEKISGYKLLAFYP
jgi:predicted Zn finger-like uncharacterized protein